MATGSSYKTLGFTFHMGTSTIRDIVLETTDAIWKALHPIFMPVPKIKDFEKISRDFYKRWNFPNCLGAIDGSHVAIKKPPNSSARFRNYKKFFSIVLQAVVSADYKFLFVDVGGAGRVSDGGILRASKFYKALTSNKFQIPPPHELPGSPHILPHYFIGDGAYPLMDNLMKPYRGTNLSLGQSIFNKRLSRCRVVVENAFGKLAQKFRIFYTTIDAQVVHVIKIVKCCCILHNLIIESEKDQETVLEDDYDEDEFDGFDDDCDIPQNTFPTPLKPYETGLVFGDGKNVQKSLSYYLLKNRKNSI